MIGISTPAPVTFTAPVGCITGAIQSGLKDFNLCMDGVVKKVPRPGIYQGRVDIRVIPSVTVGDQPSFRRGWVPQPVFQQSRQPQLYGLRRVG